MSELFASALHLDRRAVKALKITDAYSLHRVVYSLFPDVRTSEEKGGHAQSGIVYADQGGDFHGRKVLVVSDRMPNARVDGVHGEVVSKTISEAFLHHQTYRFKVQVNPVRKDKQSGKRIAVKGRQDIAQWFIERAAKSWGFEVHPQHLQIDSIEVQQFNDKHGRKITLGKAHIQGQLRVTNAPQFHHSFKHGIGKGRAFGCGLLQIVPIIENPFA
ncbi:type I-E CRISPR-associated protein Cas6/Cse3/CasE [Vibrio cholerae]|uniref:Type I-E CRISPR-associated protein Cas6/Cse3/CasE n=1 Tax=Vibrio cholerae TaxID=666 RepID=A0ABD7SRX2_VIBCL|nr:type I-E CRISPR-associated protein Cas6/Cse3/CasE [Vibrio cholerae]EKF9302750.1 type I-E CRISPR-associated protein Cas6/Cse3/CasE [Vibrio cholerae]ELY5216128.1 type I-E CRISPR-associated protein Cas6/Cse3/CasE [Vibrio cholerae]KAA1225285.1 type I-E CRISPR-associated protein Cas6/Cse3/CasE [Vibrio cholerae]MBG8946089.1 type I-E CRISPR-associated protein Cas6/Cse3/CasE [Vibrio cholerae]TXX66880.1 type I-E CRISPR-associated protein Cas6/Cse3/CasE [Vibrio cholerae]